MLTVKELKDILEKYPDEFKVILSADAEGNSFSPVSEVEPAMYVDETDWFGYVITGEDLEPGESHDCLVLWPVN